MASFSSSTPRPVVRPPSGTGGSYGRPNMLAKPPKPPGSIQGAGPWASTIQGGGPWGPAKPPAPPRPAGAAPAPTHPVTTTVTPPPPDLSGARWMGYLSPDQLGQLNTASTNYSTDVLAQQRHETDAQTAYNQQIVDSQRQHDVQQASANEALAARGLFQSSIRANDLADIDSALVERQMTAKSALDTLIADATDTISRLNAGWGGTQLTYQGIAGQNAAALPGQQPYQTTTQAPGPRLGARPGPTGPSQAPVPTPHAPTPGPPRAAGPVPPKSIIQQTLAAHPTWRAPAPSRRR